MIDIMAVIQRITVEGGAESLATELESDGGNSVYMRANIT